MWHDVTSQTYGCYSTILNSSKYSKWGKYGNVGIWHVKVAWIHLVDCYEGLYHVVPHGLLHHPFTWSQGSILVLQSLSRRVMPMACVGTRRTTWRVAGGNDRGGSDDANSDAKSCAEGCQSAPANFLSPNCGWREHLHRIYIGFTGNTCIYLILSWRTMASSNFSLEWSYPHMQWLRDACWPSFRDFDLSAGFNSVKVRFLAENVKSGLHFFCTCCTHDELLIS